MGRSISGYKEILELLTALWNKEFSETEISEQRKTQINLAERKTLPTVWLHESINYPLCVEAIPKGFDTMLIPNLKLKN